MYSLYTEQSKLHMVLRSKNVSKNESITIYLNSCDFRFSPGAPVDNKTKCFDKSANCSFLNNKTKCSKQEDKNYNKTHLSQYNCAFIW